jgi:hypothetical protein
MSALTHSPAHFLPIKTSRIRQARNSPDLQYQDHITTTNPFYPANYETSRIQKERQHDTKSPHPKSSANQPSDRLCDLPYFSPDSDDDDDDEQHHKQLQHNDTSTTTPLTKGLTIQTSNPLVPLKTNTTTRKKTIHVQSVTTHVDQLCSGEDLAPQWRRQDPYLLLLVADGHSGRECVDELEENSGTIFDYSYRYGTKKGEYK